MTAEFLVRRDLEYSWTVRADVAVVKGTDRVVVLALTPPDSIPLELAGTGLAIWRQVDGRRDTSEIVSEICRIYDTAREDVDAEVESFLVRLEHAAVLARVTRDVQTG